MSYTDFMRRLRLFLICLILFSACKDKEINKLEEVRIDPLFVRAGEIADSLDDRLLTAQILICGIEGKGKLAPGMIPLLSACPAGGVMLFRYNLDTDNDAIRSLLTETASLIQDEAGLPPFIAVDHEGGTVNRFLPGVATLPDASSYWELFQAEGGQKALEKIESDSNRAATEMSSLGINMNLAPVAEHLNNDNFDFMQRRSYGPNLFFTAQAASAFVQSMEQTGVLCVIKHFPGSAGNDPHFSASVINGDITYIGEIVYPFAYLFNNGARAVMVAHTAVPLLDSEIASLSSVVMKDLLRRDFGFDGIIICDDFSMASAGDLTSESAAIRSVSAGADMILVWPRDIARTHQAFLSALEDGQLSRERLQDAAKRIIYEKLRMGLIDGE